MARASSSGSRGRGRRGGSHAQGSGRARAGAPPAVDALPAGGPQLNPELVAMPATEIFAYLNRNLHKANFDDAALVFADRERMLAEAKGRLAEAEGRLQDEIRERDAQIRVAEETEAALRAWIRALQHDLRAADADARHGSGGVRGRGVTKQAGRGREPVPQVSVTASNDGVGLDTGAQAMFAEGKVGHNAPRARYYSPYNSLRMNACNAPVPGLQAFDDLPARKRRRAPRIPPASALPAGATTRKKKAKVTGDGVGSNNVIRPGHARRGRGRGRAVDPPRKSPYRANRMSATPPALLLSNQPRRRGWSKSAAMEEDSEDGESSQN